MVINISGTKVVVIFGSLMINLVHQSHTNAIFRGPKVHPPQPTITTRLALALMTMPTRVTRCQT